MKKARILMVEDDLELCEELIPILEDKGYLLDVSHDGKSAIAQLERDGYGLMLLDLKMPGINGYEVLKCARKFHPDVKIIVLSGSPLRPEVKKSEDQIFPGGVNYAQLISDLADAYVSKPFDVEQLLSTIREIFPA